MYPTFPFLSNLFYVTSHLGLSQIVEIHGFFFLTSIYVAYGYLFLNIYYSS